MAIALDSKAFDVRIKVVMNGKIDGKMSVRTEYIYLKDYDTVKTLVEKIRGWDTVADPKPIGSEVATGKKIHIYNYPPDTKLSALNLDFSKKLCLVGISPGPKSYCWGACLCGGAEIQDD